MTHPLETILEEQLQPPKKSLLSLEATSDLNVVKLWVAEEATKHSSGTEYLTMSNEEFRNFLDPHIAVPSKIQALTSMARRAVRECTPEELDRMTVSPELRPYLAAERAAEAVFTPGSPYRDTITDIMAERTLEERNWKFRP